MKKAEQKDDKKKQEMYAGGNNAQGMMKQRSFYKPISFKTSTHRVGGGSGMAVLGPPPARGAPGARGPPSANIFDRLHEAAVQNVSSPDESGSIDTGRRITMYRNGFTVDDGPLRDVTSPENAQFLAILEAGRVPPELLTGKPAVDTEVRINLSDKRSEDYIPPAYIAYSGTGHSLRSDPAAGGSASEAYVFSPEIVADADIPAVDDAQPVTTVQVHMLLSLWRISGTFAFDCLCCLFYSLFFSLISSFIFAAVSCYLSLFFFFPFVSPNPAVTIFTPTT